jgi:hypothetical protein
MAYEFRTFGDWYTGNCQYECTLCIPTKVYGISTVFFHHVKNQHDMSRSVFKQAYPNYRIVTNRMTCKMCGEEFLFDHPSIVLHFAQNHGGMTTEAYFSSHVLVATEPKRRIP